LDKHEYTSGCGTTLSATTVLGNKSCSLFQKRHPPTTKAAPPATLALFPRNDEYRTAPACAATFDFAVASVGVDCASAPNSAPPLPICATLLEKTVLPIKPPARAYIAPPLCATFPSKRVSKKITRPPLA
jgi:hypothetical protein